MRACLVGIAFLACAALAIADAPAVKHLAVRRSGNTTYFHVRFDSPQDMLRPAVKPGPYGEYARRRLALQPRLVPQDGKTWAVYPRLDVPHFKPAVQFDAKMDLPAIDGLEFVGKVREKGKARFLLLYPTSVKEKAPAGIRDKELAELLRPVRWAEVEVELDVGDAASVAKPVPRAKSPTLAASATVWAQAQAHWLALQEPLAPELGFHGFACAATARKYGVADPVLEGERKKAEEHIHRRMLDLTTGTTAITQSLALKRLRNKGAREPAKRWVNAALIPGITIAEHPWEKMMAGKKPAAEPLATLIPHDNYYFRFKSFAKFAEIQDFLDQWGTPAGRAYEVLSREHGLKERYERQLCLKSTWLGRQFGPLLVKSVAVTGNDPYLREGSDITVIFHVNNRQAFLAGVEPFLKEARKEFGDDLRAGKDQHLGIAIESFVTPLREVSVHRAAFADFVVYSNSPVGLRRVLDVHKGKAMSLAKSLDFQYMRTVFRAEDKAEDGFAFLSDAFIRQLVGPASKIKEMRRLEALTSLSMLTHGALFTAWETGKLPASHDALMSAAALSPAHLYVPDGKPPRWDVARLTAVSDVYNTIHFAAPLVELPIDRVTFLEEETYV
ncbi:MAG: hypothetical protein FJ271_23710 [Planctomycetes bacterium]|nr:hypothetical protein [Planctomycetota bacterium]